MKKLLILILPVLLVGCAVQQKNNQPTTPDVFGQVRHVEVDLQQLALDKKLEEKVTAIPSITSYQDTITIYWNGDVADLLRLLAKSRHKIFRYVGLPLPLPISLHEQLRYEDVLQVIQLQTQYRAKIKEDDKFITLIYNHMKV